MSQLDPHTAPGRALVALGGAVAAESGNAEQIAELLPRAIRISEELLRATMHCSVPRIKGRYKLETRWEKLERLLSQHLTGQGSPSPTQNPDIFDLLAEKNGEIRKETLSKDAYFNTRDKTLYFCPQNIAVYAQELAQKNDIEIDNDYLFFVTLGITARARVHEARYAITPWLTELTNLKKTERLAEFPEIGKDDIHALREGEVRFIGSSMAAKLYFSSNHPSRNVGVSPKTVSKFSYPVIRELLHPSFPGVSALDDEPLEIVGEKVLTEIQLRYGTYALNLPWESPLHIPLLEEYDQLDSWYVRVIRLGRSKRPSLSQRAARRLKTKLGRV